MQRKKHNPRRGYLFLAALAPDVGPCSVPVSGMDPRQDHRWICLFEVIRTDGPDKELRRSCRRVHSDMTDVSDVPGRSNRVGNSSARLASLDGGSSVGERSNLGSYAAGAWWRKSQVVLPRVFKLGSPTPKCYLAGRRSVDPTAPTGNRSPSSVGSFVRTRGILLKLMSFIAEQGTPDLYSK